jgi:hypothetical protein
MPNMCKWIPVLRNNCPQPRLATGVTGACKMGFRFLLLVAVLLSPVWKQGYISSVGLKPLKEW